MSFATSEISRDRVLLASLRCRIISSPLAMSGSDSQGHGSSFILSPQTSINRVITQSRACEIVSCWNEYSPRELSPLDGLNPSVSLVQDEELNISLHQMG